MEAELGQQQGTPREPVRLIAVKLYFSVWLSTLFLSDQVSASRYGSVCGQATSHIKDFCRARKLLIICPPIGSRKPWGVGGPLRIDTSSRNGTDSSRLNRSADHATLVNYARSCWGPPLQACRHYRVLMSQRRAITRALQGLSLRKSPAFSIVGCQS